MLVMNHKPFAYHPYGSKWSSLCPEEALSRTIARGYPPRDSRVHRGHRWDGRNVGGVVQVPKQRAIGGIDLSSVVHPTNLEAQSTLCQ